MVLFLELGCCSFLLFDAFMKYAEMESEAWQLSDAPTNPSGPERHAFDLEERTAQFGEAIIRFVKKIPRNAENNR